MAGLLEYTCASIIQRQYHVALANDVEYVFFIGGFVDNPVVRKVMSKFALMSMLMGAQKKKVRE